MTGKSRAPARVSYLSGRREVARNWLPRRDAPRMVAVLKLPDKGTSTDINYGLTSAIGRR